MHYITCFLGSGSLPIPAARPYASPQLRRKRQDLSFDAELGDAPEPEMGG
jgi:hypothetical protein